MLKHGSNFFLSGDNPDLLYQELASDNELEKSVHDGGNLKLIFLRTKIASTRRLMIIQLFVGKKHVYNEIEYTLFHKAFF